MTLPDTLVDPLAALRAYRVLAPWGLRDLAALAGGVLEASAVIPLSAAARTRPTERTIRFYVARGLVSPPEGRGTAAMYGYKHFLQVLAIKLRQMEGATLEVLTREFADQAGDQLERRVASVLGPQLPPPGEVALGASAPSRGRGARALGPKTVGPGHEASYQILIVLALALALPLAACGEQSIEVPASSPQHAGAELFQQRCGGCHTFSAAATQGSAANVRTRERTDGPNFNSRRECVERVLYAIENGGFSGAIMPQNIVVGDEAKQVARFVAKYAGQEANATPRPTSSGSASGLGR
jgi:mono/diheme cytochrome c family protein